MTEEAVIGLIESQHKPSWEDLLAHAESQKTSGRVVAKTAEELRRQLQAALDKANEEFIQARVGALGHFQEYRLFSNHWSWERFSFACGFTQTR